MMPGHISDSELRQRLEEHNYAVPPITTTTRNVLQKKLKQLDQQQRQSTKMRNSSSQLSAAAASGIDYSSAEEDFTPRVSSTKKNTGHRSSRSSTTTVRNGTSTPSNHLGRTRESQLTYPFKTPAVSPSRSSRNGSVGLMNQSSEEEEEEEESEEADEESDENHELYEEAGTVRGKADLAVQTSFASPEVDVRFRGKPLTPGGSATNSNQSYPIKSHKIRQNLDKFGSLNEALATLPTNNKPTPSKLNSVSRNACVTPQPVSPVTQVNRSSSHQNYRRGVVNRNAVPISTLIILLAVLFFTFVGYQYLNLTHELAPPKIPICTHHSSKVGCIPGEQLTSTENILERLLKILKESDSCASSNKHSMIEIKELLEIESNSQMEQFESLMENVLILLKQNPTWGVEPVFVDKEVTHLSVTEPSFGLVCWVKLLTGLVYDLIVKTANYLLVIGVSALLLACSVYVWRCWRSKQRQRRQEMYALVERVLNMLHENHQCKDGHGPSYLAIDHIRDQLIPPQERIGKGGIWKDVLKYMANEESRVREEIQIIHGEEFRVWQWLPDLPVSPVALAPTDLYTVRMNNALNRTPISSNVRPSYLGERRSAQLSPHRPEPWQYVPTSTASPPGWQGSAFQHNAAAASEAPTSCLKVRYMFDQGQSQLDWIAMLKNDIISRCKDARILHIEVDQESQDGVVYIKTMSKEDAAIVFQCMHGQWYKRQLVSAKYLKLERYHQRFPDSAKANEPMKCGM